MRSSIDPYGITSVGAAVAAAPISEPVQVSALNSMALIEAVDFSEALYQTRPLVDGGTRAVVPAAKLVAESTARTRGLRPETAFRLVTSPRDLLSFVTGAHPSGKAAEVVVACNFRSQHASGRTGMRNSPRGGPGNVLDVRLSPDTASRRDLFFQIRTRGGLLTVVGGQVKTGSGRYVSASLVRMAQTPGYGRTGYVDARFVNRDGTPRIASDGFTINEARRLNEAGVELRGICDLEERARRLVRNIVEHAEDGLDPLARHELLSLRNEIAESYGASRIAARVAGGAVSAAAMSAVVSLLVQYASNGAITVAQASSAGAGAAMWGVAGTTADACLYHAATSVGLPPEAAKAFARKAVSTGFCLLAVAGDALAEARAVRERRISVFDALSGVAFKSVLGALPLIMPPLGFAGVPLIAAIQVGGRWAIAALRNREAILARAIAEDLEVAAAIEQRLERMSEGISRVKSECDDTDRLFEQVMSPVAPSSLRVAR